MTSASYANQLFGSITFMNNYSSYLIRHWLLTEDPTTDCAEQKVRQVFDVEHVQSGRRTRLGSLNEAQTWIEAVSMGARELKDEFKADEQSEVAEPSAFSGHE